MKYQTTQQIKEAPLNSIYIWANDDINIPKAMAEKLGRQDIRFYGFTQFLANLRNLSHRKDESDIILDHATADKICSDEYLYNEINTFLELELTRSEGKKHLIYTHIKLFEVYNPKLQIREIQKQIIMEENQPIYTLQYRDLLFTLKASPDGQYLRFKLQIKDYSDIAYSVALHQLIHDYGLYKISEPMQREFAKVLGNRMSTVTQNLLRRD